MVYSWKDQFSYKIPAEVVGKEFEKLERKNGGVTRENVLDSARSSNSPLHELFEWNDTVAAEQYRLQQATTLICALHIEVDSQDDEPQKLRAYVNVGDERSGRFINIDTAFQNNETRDIVLERALRELKAFEKKYRALSEFSSLFAEINKLTA